MLTCEDCDIQGIVKQLSTTYTQGENEFKNEVIYMTKLQQRNLVKIVGYCIEDE